MVMKQAKSKAVTAKQSQYQRANMPMKPGPNAPFKRSAKEDGVRAQGPTARASGKAPFPGVTAGSGGSLDTQVPASQRKSKNYPGGRADVQPREKGVRY